jgi:hypothetical protein
MIWYVRFITRPRFKFPEGALRKPTQFHVSGFDPETGTKMDTTQTQSAMVGDQSAVSQALKELQWLADQGQ